MAKKTSRSAAERATEPGSDLAVAAADSGVPTDTPAATDETIPAPGETETPPGDTNPPPGDTPAPAEEPKEPDRIEVIAKRLEEIAAAIAAIGDPDIAMDTARERFLKAHEFQFAEEKRLKAQTEALRDAMNAENTRRNELLEQLRRLKIEAGELVEEDASIRSNREAAKLQVEAMLKAREAQHIANNPGGLAAAAAAGGLT